MVQETIQYVPVERIQRDTNIRQQFSEEELHGLMQSLIEVGQLVPIRVRRRGDDFLIIDGERRFRVAKKAGWKTLAVIVENDDLSEADVKQRQLVCNVQRADLSQLEIAEALRDLLQLTGWKATEAAAKLGFSNARVSRLLALLKLPDAIRDEIRTGKISTSAGYELARVDDAGQQAALAEQIAGGQLTRDGLSGVVKRTRSQQNENSSDATPRLTALLSGGRSITLAGGGLNSLDVLIAWLEELLAKARKGRPKGLELGTFVRILRDEAKAH